MGLRALLGLYPGYGMNPVEELRRQTYAVLATLAITATFVVALRVDDMVSRSVLAMGCVGLVLLASLVRQLAKWRLMRWRLWGKPVVVFSSGGPGGHVAALLVKGGVSGASPSPCSAATLGKIDETTRRPPTRRAWLPRRGSPGGTGWIR